jgi:GNAT superfamily N-acetyltransferase
VITRGQRDQFVRFPAHVYRSDPSWVQPLELERNEFLSRRKHPFYRHGDALPLLAMRDGRVVGRILVSDDPRYNSHHGTNVGAFGLFESIDDHEVSEALLDAAERWLLARGRTGMLGPIDYSTNYQCGLLIKGFDTPPRVMMNHNPPYYQELIETYGLTKAKDLYAWWFNDPHCMIEKWRRRVERSARHGISIRQLDPKDLGGEVMRCRNLYNEVLGKHWGFVPMTDAEFRYYADFLEEMAVPEFLIVAEHAGQPVGFSITLPDFNEAIKPLNGRLTKWGLPIGYLRFRQGLKQIKTARLIAMGVLDAYRRRGIAEMLILHTLQTGKVLRLFDAELSWTLEDNHLINRPIEIVGGQQYKTYRIYEKSFGRASR